MCLTIRLPTSSFWQAGLFMLLLPGFAVAQQAQVRSYENPDRPSDRLT